MTPQLRVSIEYGKALEPPFIYSEGTHLPPHIFLLFHHPLSKSSESFTPAMVPAGPDCEQQNAERNKCAILINALIQLESSSKKPRGG